VCLDYLFVTDILYMKYLYLLGLCFVSCVDIISNILIYLDFFHCIVLYCNRTCLLGQSSMTVQLQLALPFS
jgi:hypothetical protein